MRTPSIKTKNTLIIYWDNSKVVHTFGDRVILKRDYRGKLERVWAPGHRKLIETFKVKTIEAATKLLDRRRKEHIFKAIFNDGLGMSTKLI